RQATMGTGAGGGGGARRGCRSACSWRRSLRQTQKATSTTAKTSRYFIVRLASAAPVQDHFKHEARADVAQQQEAGTEVERADGCAATPAQAPAAQQQDAHGQPGQHREDGLVVPDPALVEAFGKP